MALGNPDDLWDICTHPHQVLGIESPKKIEKYPPKEWQILIAYPRNWCWYSPMVAVTPKKRHPSRSHHWWPVITGTGSRRWLPLPSRGPRGSHCTNLGNSSAIPRAIPRFGQPKWGNLLVISCYIYLQYLQCRSNNWVFSLAIVEIGTAHRFGCGLTPGTVGLVSKRGQAHLYYI